MENDWVLVPILGSATWPAELRETVGLILLYVVAIDQAGMHVEGQLADNNNAAPTRCRVTMIER